MTEQEQFISDCFEAVASEFMKKYPNHYIDVHWNVEEFKNLN